MTAGYSETPLARKLGIKPGYRVRTSAAPEGYAEWLHPIPRDVTISGRIRSKVDVWHHFTTSRSDLERALPRMMKSIRPDAAIWVSWPKKSSGLKTTVDGDTIRELALPLGLVDIKVCAVDETWSGRKLVIRKELRPQKGV